MLPGKPNGTYDPQKVILSFGGIVITGYAKGSFIKAKRNTDTFKTVVGAAGEESWDKSADRSGEVEVTLMATSQDNDAFSAMLAADELAGTGLAPLLGKDLNGTTLFHAAFARLAKPADIERAVDQGNAVWVLRTTNLEIFVGGIVA